MLPLASIEKVKLSLVVASSELENSVRSVYILGMLPRASIEKIKLSLVFASSALEDSVRSVFIIIILVNVAPCQD